MFCTELEDMKIGRNDLCPCGSGRKFKKCHLGKDIFTESHVSFVSKGQSAERFIQELAQQTFLTDWCYPNPILPDGRELCDLLVVFDNIAIIWQIKNVDTDKDGNYKESDLQKNLRQLSGARRQLFDLESSITLNNPRRGKELFDPATIQHVYLVSVMFTECETFFSSVEEIKNHTVHVFTGTFAQLVLKELDTLKDFVDYLRAKEDLIKQVPQITILGGEEELLASYIFDGRSFQRFLGNNSVYLEEGIWKKLQQMPEYKQRALHNQISYVWDNIIDSAHQAQLREYELVAREMAKCDRFRRRSLGKAFMDAWDKAALQDKPVFRRVVLDPNVDTTICFLFTEEADEERRKTLLYSMCLIARGKWQERNKVLGIAIGKNKNIPGSGVFCLLDISEWTKELQEQADELQKATATFTSLEQIDSLESEYPPKN
jgi:hypothetical protein